MDWVTWTFADSHCVVVAKNLFIHFAKVVVHMRPVDEEGRTIGVLLVAHGTTLGIIGGFGDEIDHVHAKSIDAFLEPPAHDFVDFFSNARILPFQVWLLRSERVQVVLACDAVMCLGRNDESRRREHSAYPSRAAETGTPTVRWLSIRARCPVVEIPVGIVFALSRFDEPGMLVARVIDNEIHHQLQLTLFHRFEKQVEIVHRAEFCHNFRIITDVVTIVVIGRIVDWTRE